MTPEQLKVLTRRLAEGFVREGLLVLPELTDEQLDARFNELVFRCFGGRDEFDYALTFDHTGKLLEEATRFESQHDAELCCLFFMLWIEHRINLILRVMLRRKQTSDRDAIAIVRKLAIREKLTWFWQLLELDPIPDDILLVITTIEEFRNGFVHFKWPSFESFSAEDRAWQAVNKVQDVISALRVCEDKHVFYGQRHRLAELAKRTRA